MDQRARVSAALPLKLRRFVYSSPDRNTSLIVGSLPGIIFSLRSPVDQRRRRIFFLKVSENCASPVTMVIHPDESEFYANLARRASAFVDLDPRRVDALKICKEYRFFCADISHYIYQRALEEGKNPYFINNHHLSIAGTRIVAESFIAHWKQISQSANAPSSGAY